MSSAHTRTIFFRRLSRSKTSTITNDEKLRGSIKNKRFVNLGYLEEFSALRDEIKRLLSLASLSGETASTIIEQATKSAASLADLSTNKISEFGAGVNKDYNSDDDDEELTWND